MSENTNNTMGDKTDIVIGVLKKSKAVYTMTGMHINRAMEYLHSNAEVLELTPESQEWYTQTYKALSDMWFDLSRRSDWNQGQIERVTNDANS